MLNRLERLVLKINKIIDEGARLWDRNKAITREEGGPMGAEQEIPTLLGIPPIPQKLIPLGEGDRKDIFTDQERAAIQSDAIRAVSHPRS